MMSRMKVGIITLGVVASVVVGAMISAKTKTKTEVSSKPSYWADEARHRHFAKLEKAALDRHRSYGGGM